MFTTSANIIRLGSSVRHLLIQANTNPAVTLLWALRRDTNT